MFLIKDKNNMVIKFFTSFCRSCRADSKHVYFVGFHHGVIFLNFQARMLGGRWVKNCLKKYNINYFGYAVSKFGIQI